MQSGLENSWYREAKGCVEDNTHRRGITTESVLSRQWVVGRSARQFRYVPQESDAGTQRLSLMPEQRRVCQHDCGENRQ